MISMTANGIGRFLAQPMEALEDMRAATPGVHAALLAIISSILMMAVLDLTYGPLAFPQSVAPGGKRDAAVFALAFMEIARAFAVASLVLIGVRHILKSDITVAEALWMTVPFTLALLGLEVLQASTWLIFLATGLDVYGPMLTMGFIGVTLILAASIRTLAPERDWLSCLPVCLGAFVIGFSAAPLVLAGTAVYLLIRGK